MFLIAVLNLSLSLLVGLRGNDKLEEYLARAAHLSELGQPIIAAGLYGEALGQKFLAEDLPAQQSVAEPLAALLGADPDPESLLAVMEALPPKPSGAFVSAHSLAQVLAYDAMSRDDFLFGRELGETLQAHSKGRHVGAAAKVFAQLGEALAKLSRYETKGAVRLLEKALKQMLKQGWDEAAIHVGTELAAQHLLLNEPKDATEVIEQLAELFADGGDLLMLGRWRELVSTRLGDAPAAVLAAHRALLPRLPEPPADEPGDAATVPAAGGAAEDGVPERPAEPSSDSPPEPADGAGRLTAVAGALADRRTVELLSIARDGGEWWIRSGLGSGLDLHLDLAPGVVLLHHEGLVFAIDGPTVAVLALNTAEHLGAARPLDSLSPSQARYLLADGETFRLDSRAAVSVR